MTESELRGKKFLDFVAQNEKRLKRNLRKNISFDVDLFDDIFQDSIIKVYTTIVKNNKDIDDFERYFYISSKYNYILKQNSERDRLKKLVNIDEYIQNDDLGESTPVVYDAMNVIEDVREIIEDEFGDEYAAIYFDYMSMKIKGGMSYVKYSELTGVPTSKVSEVVSKIKQFTKNNDKIKKIKNAIYS